MSSAEAFGPATVGNAAVGFDVLGFALEAPIMGEIVSNSIGDRVQVKRIDEPTVRIERINRAGADLPRDPTKNTASVALIAMRDALGLEFGFEIIIRKGIPIGSGLGGSAASAVAAVVAANSLLDDPRSKDELFEWALAGEAVASGHAHPDNVAPCLYGGLTLTAGDRVQVVPSPDLWVNVVHPDTIVETRMARQVLPAEVPLTAAVKQMGHLAAFVDACHRGDVEAVAAHCVDGLIEPYRKALIPGFDAAARAARDAGALTFSLSGSGPAVFSVCHDYETAMNVSKPVMKAFAEAGLDSQTWTSPFGGAAARVL